MVSRSLKISICRSVAELRRIRPLWERLCASGRYTAFQSFALNLLAAEHFAEREEPYVICAESSGGAAIVPAALRHGDGSIRLLGEELFDYRCFLHQGDAEVLRSALGALAPLRRPLEIVALRETDCGMIDAHPALKAASPSELAVSPYTLGLGISGNGLQ